MATTNINALKQVSRRVKKAGGGRSVKAKPQCWGKEDSKHLDCCTPSSPKCRWRRAPTRCYCMAYPFPHRLGSGFCGNADRQNELIHGLAQVKPLPIGAGMSETRWWRARLAVVRAIGIEGGACVITPETAALCRDWLEGRATAPAAIGDSPLRGEERRRLYVAARAVVDALLPLLAEYAGAVIPASLGEHVRALLTGSIKAPVLRNARKLAKTHARPYEFTPPAATGTDDVIPF